MRLRHWCSRRVNEAVHIMRFISMWRSVYPCMSLSIACSISMGSDNTARSMQWIIRDLTKLRRRRQGTSKKNNRFNLMSKTTTLHVHHAFLYISLLSLHNNDVKWPHFEYGNDKAINSTISVWTRARPPLFSSNQNSLLLSNRANSDNRENV